MRKSFIHFKSIELLREGGCKFERLDKMFDDRENGHFWFYEDVRAKMTLKEINDYYDWKVNLYAALPQWVTLYSKKVDF